MRLILTIILATILTLPAFAEYTIILRDGTTYRAQKKWTVAEDGQALITLDSGTQIKLDSRLIDVSRTDEANRLGLGDARLLKVEEPTTSATPQQSPLGSVTTLRRNQPPASTPTEDGRPTTLNQPGAGAVDKDTISKFRRAYDNVGLYDAKVESLRQGELRIAVTTNNEDEVFKAISATAFLVSNLEEVEQVELLMSTLNGGSAGKFQMNSGDAKALSGKHINWQSYYVQKVIY